MKLGKEFIILGLIVYAGVLCIRGNSDPVMERGYPNSKPIEYQADSSLYYRNLPITTRKRDTTPYKGRYIDVQ